jgi:hypothetical protein
MRYEQREAGNRGRARVCAIMVLALTLASMQAQAQSPPEGVFVAYEALEMAMNEFRNFAGEVGYRFGPKWQARLTMMEVNLTERHLASKWESAAVDGPDVTGYMRGYEAHLDRFFAGNWYLSGAAGYYEDSYRHTVLDASIHNRTLTVGAGIGYSRSNLVGVERLYLNLHVPVRYYFNPIEETKWGETRILPHVVVNNVWLFVGFRL